MPYIDHQTLQDLLTVCRRAHELEHDSLQRGLITRTITRGRECLPGTAAPAQPLGLFITHTSLVAVDGDHQVVAPLPAAQPIRLLACVMAQYRLGPVWVNGSVGSKRKLLKERAPDHLRALGLAAFAREIEEGLEVQGDGKMIWHGLRPLAGGVFLPAWYTGPLHRGMYRLPQ